MTNVFLYANNDISALAANITNVALSLTLTTGSGALFPNPAAGQQFALTLTDAATGLLNEIVYVTARTGDVCTIVRAQEGTSAKAWSAGDIAAGLVTAGCLAQFPQGAALPATGAQLQYTSATALLLAPYAGGQLWINGANYAVPASLSLANTGLTASTLYRIYAFMNAGTMTLEASTTVAVANANGIPQKSGDATRTQVGLIYTTNTTPGQFSDSLVLRNVASYFNRTNRPLAGAFSNQVPVSSGTPVEVTSAARCEAVTWLNEGSALSVNGSGYISSSTTHPSVTVGIDSASQGAGTSGTLVNANDVCGLTALYNAFLSEGHHVFSPFAYSQVPSATTFNASLAVAGIIRS